MRILHIIGNGFDLNLGLKTSYKDFLDFYKKLSSSTDTIKKLKENMGDTIINWSDMELALGEYTRNVDSNDEFDEIHSDIVEQLSDYLESEEASYDFSMIDKKELFDYLLSPENQLLPADKSIIEIDKKKYQGSPNQINIINFNYTRSLELILGGSSNILSPKITRIETRIDKIIHVHGTTRENVILGVNDDTQIANNKFKLSQDVKDFIVKRDSYRALKTRVDDECKKLISEAQLICVFGSSFGATDKYWWELLGKKIMDSTKLIVFYKCEEISARRKYSIGKRDRSYLQKLTGSIFSSTQTDDDKAKIVSNIILSANSRMFNLTHSE